MTGTEPSLQAQLQRRAYWIHWCFWWSSFAINPVVEWTGKKWALPRLWQLRARDSLQRRQENWS